MATLLIDIHDVTATPVEGDTVTLTAPAPRPSTSGGVTRPFDRLTVLDKDGRATVDVEPGPLRVSFHDAYDRDVVVDVTVPAEGDTFTLRELIVSEIGTVDDVPGIREALDGKADVEHHHEIVEIIALSDHLMVIDARLDGKADLTHTHAMRDIDDLDDALDGKADVEHNHGIADIDALQTALDRKAEKVHRHTIADIDDLTWSLDQKVNTYDLEQTVYDFAAARIAEIVDGAPESLDTLREVAEALANQDDSIKAILEAVGERAMKSHKHDVADVNGLQTALDGKAAKTHKHDVADVNGLQTALDGKAASPVIFARENERWSIVGRTPEDWSFWGLGRLYLPPGSYFVLGSKVENIELRSDKSDVPNRSVTLPGVVTVTADKSHLLPLAPLQNDSALLVLPAAV